jgi:hypothetical protein
MRHHWHRPLRLHPFAKRFTALTITLLLALGLVVPAAAQPSDLATRAREYVAGNQGIPVDQLEVATTTRTRLPLTGANLIDFKVMARDGRSFGVSFDVMTEQVVDSAAAAQQEQQARVAKYGVLEPALYEQLQNSPGSRIPVGVWVRMEDPGTLARGANPNFNALATRVRAAQAPAANAARGLGAAIAQADLVPVFFAELNAGQINALSHRPDVMAIELIPTNLARHNDDSSTSNRYPFIWSSARGAGAVVAVHEDDGVDNVNTFLVDPVYWCTGVGTGPGGAACTVGRNIGSHATNVAGVIASTHQWRRGGAWGIAAGSLLSANFQSFSGSGTPTSATSQKIVNSATWALNSGADTINMSWGSICSNGNQNFFSRWVDYLVKATGDNIVASAGNSTCPSGTPQYVGAPSLGWNAISVGAYWDTDTGLRSDDVLSSFSSFVNPTDPNSGRTYEKPDVAGMGGQSDATGCHGTETTAVGGGVGDTTCGTSFAAPDVSALTALIVGKNPTGLRNNAEVVKAIVMAGATHNIVDGANYTSCSTSPIAGDCRDGAGALDAYQTIQNIVTPGNWRFPGFITPSSFDAAGNIDYPVSIGSGKNIRVAIAWDSTAVCSNLGTSSQGCSSDVLNADLDLQLVNPAGTVVASSSSFQNSAEVIDYKTTTSGTWTVRIRNFRFDAGTNTYLGVAWNLNTVDSRNPLTGATSFALNTTKTNQTTDKGRSFWDTYSGAGCDAFLSAETGLEKVYTVNTSSTGAIQASLSTIVGFSGVNSDIDVIILKKSGAANSQNTKVVACGDTSATASGQPAGTYYVVVDGFAGSVAKFNIAVNFTSGAAAASVAPVPVR